VHGAEGEQERSAVVRERRRTSCRCGEPAGARAVSKGKLRELRKSSDKLSERVAWEGERRLGGQVAPPPERARHARDLAPRPAADAMDWPGRAASSPSPASVPLPPRRSHTRALAAQSLPARTSSRTRSLGASRRKLARAARPKRTRRRRLVPSRVRLVPLQYLRAAASRLTCARSLVPPPPRLSHSQPLSPPASFPFVRPAARAPLGDRSSSPRPPRPSSRTPPQPSASSTCPALEQASAPTDRPNARPAQPAPRPRPSSSSSAAANSRPSSSSPLVSPSARAVDPAHAHPPSFTPLARPSSLPRWAAAAPSPRTRRARRARMRSRTSCARTAWP